LTLCVLLTIKLDVMAKSKDHYFAGAAFGTSAGSYVYGTGGGNVWWQNYDKAKIYMREHGSLVGFNPSDWPAYVRQLHKEGKLTPDQVHYLKKIDFELTAQPKGWAGSGATIKKGSRLQMLIVSKAQLDEVGVDNLSEDELVFLKAELQYYEGRYKGGNLGNASARKLGVDDPVDYGDLVRSIVVRLESLKSHSASEPT